MADIPERLRAEKRALNDMLDAEKTAAMKAVKALTARVAELEAELAATERTLNAWIVRAKELEQNPCPPQQREAVKSRDVIPCDKLSECDWPACPPTCKGRPGGPMPTPEKIEAAKKSMLKLIPHDLPITERDVAVLAEAALAAAEAVRWQPISTEPSDDSDIWLSDGKSVWGPGKAHKDGSLKLPSRSSCKFWCPAHIPLPPKEETE